MESELTAFEKILLPSFLNALSQNNIIIDLSDVESEIIIKFNKEGEKFLKKAKKIDKHFNVDNFIEKIIRLAIEKQKEEPESIEL